MRETLTVLLLLLLLRFTSAAAWEIYYNTVDNNVNRLNSNGRRIL